MECGNEQQSIMITDFIKLHNQIGSDIMLRNGTVDDDGIMISHKSSVGLVFEPSSINQFNNQHLQFNKLKMN